MYCRCLVVGFLAVFACVTQAATPIELAMGAIQEAIPQARKDPNRPVYHFRPPAQWMNDINGPLYYGGWYHVFYQHNPYQDTWEYMHWGHARSRDLVYWEHQPVALWPSYEKGEKHCYSGGAAVNAKGQPMLFYTSIGPEYREEWAAVSYDDMESWVKSARNPVLHHRDKTGASFSAQDPFLFRARDKTFMVCTSFNGERPLKALHLYEAANGELTEWTYLGEFFGHAAPCPNIFQLQDKWVLVLHGRDYYIGTIDWKRHKFVSESRGIAVQGATHNARGANILLDEPNQRPIFLAWVVRTKGYDQSGRGWHGCMSLPAEPFLGEDDRLWFRPIRELQKLRQEEVNVPAFQVKDECRRLSQIGGDTLEIEFTARVDDAQVAGLRLRCGQDGQRAVILSWCNGELSVSGTGEKTTKVALPLDEDRRLRLHVFLDKAVMEYFAQAGRVYGVEYLHSRPGDDGLEVFAEGGRIDVEKCDIWHVKSIW